MSDGVSSVPPTSAFMSVRHVMDWIAFRQVRERDDIDETLDFVFRWSDSDVGPILEALEARADAEPYYVVQPSLYDGDPWDRRSYVHRAFSPAAPKLLRAIRAKARKREGRLVTYADLAAALRSEILHTTEENELLKHAHQKLMEAVRAARLPVWARQDVKRGHENPAAVHAPAPIAIFMNELVTVTEWGTIGADSDHATAIYSYQGPEFRDVRFVTADVLAVWPPTNKIEDPPKTQTANPSPVRDRSGGGRSAKHDWELFWIEVALYAALNDLAPEHRSELQRHMQDWCARAWVEAPNEATIRSRLKRLFDARKSQSR